MRPLVLLVIIGILAGSTAGASAPQKITITMTEFRFTPPAITVAAGAVVDLTVVNRGTIPHEFMLSEIPGHAMHMMDMHEWAETHTYFQNIGPIQVTLPGQKPASRNRLGALEVDPGKSVMVRFTAARRGTFEYACHLAGHNEAGMKGRLTVK